MINFNGATTQDKYTCVFHYRLCRKIADICYLICLKYCDFSCV